MNLDAFSFCRCLTAASLLAIGSSVGVSGWTAPALAGPSETEAIVPDASLGEERSRLRRGESTGRQQETLIEGGAQRGENLFHSFERFGIGENEAVRFVVPLADSASGAVSRIFTRVSGDRATRILGTLGTTAAADLFLINPNGVFLGPNARLDVRGSFVASTAESILFENGFAFGTTDPQAPPLLTVSVPIGLQLGQNPAPIQVEGAGSERIIPSVVQTVLGPIERPPDIRGALEVPAGNTLALVGGAISLDGGLLVAESGRVVLGGIGSGESVRLAPHPAGWDFDFGAVSQFANVELGGRALVDASGTTAGFIGLFGADITLNEEALVLIQQSDFQPTDKAGGVAANATGLLEIDRAAIEVSALPGDDPDAAAAEAGSRIEIAAGELIGRNGGAIGSSSFTNRDSAAIEVTVEKAIDLRGLFPDQSDPVFVLPSRILTAAVADGSSGGEVRVSAENIRLVRSGAIGSISIAEAPAPGSSIDADAGNVTVRAAEAIVVDGSVPGTTFGLSQILSSTFTAGDGGTLIIDTGTLSIRNGGRVNTAASDSGTAGNATIVAREAIEITGSGLFSGSPEEEPMPVVSSIQAGVDTTDGAVEVVVATPSGQTGSLTVATPSLRVDRGGEIAVGNEGPNDGGELNIFADTVFVGTGAQISATTLEGQGGTISIQPLAGAPPLLTDSFGAPLRSLARSAGLQLTLDGPAAAISAQAISLPITDDAGEPILDEAGNARVTIGNAGSVTIAADEASIRNGASINVSSEFGEAGTLTIDANNLELATGSLTAIAGASNGTDVGNIVLDLSESLFLRDESLISAEASGTANGGNVSINAGVAVVAFPATGSEGSDIVASSVMGQGGNIDITTQGLFGLDLGSAEDANGQNDLDPSSAFGLDGTVAINTPEVDPSQDLAALEAEPAVAAENQLAACTAETLLTRQHRGLPPTPNDMLGAIATSPLLPAALPTSPTAGTPLQEATAWQLAANGTVELTARSSAAIASQAERGRERYAARDWAGAVAQWQQVAEALLAGNDRLGAATVFGNLSLALQQLGHWPQARKAIAAADRLLAAAPENRPNAVSVRAQLTGVRGQLNFATGHADAAARRWQAAATLYLEQGDRAAATRSGLARARALERLGAAREAEQLLLELQPQWQQQSAEMQILGLQRLASLQRSLGDFAAAEMAWRRSLALARERQDRAAVYAALLGLGNLARARENPQAAKGLYQQVIVGAPLPLLRVRAQLNQLALTPDAGSWRAIRDAINRLPPSRESLYARLNLAGALLERLPTSQQQEAIDPLLAVAVAQGRELGDETATIWALGARGRLAEGVGDGEAALGFTRQALLAAQERSAPELVYRWQWQLGRLLAAAGRTEAAIATYGSALESLQSLRGELAAAGSDEEYAFRTEIEPLYRQYADLLLQPDASGQVPQKNLQQARLAIEALRLAELDNFFQDNCLASTPVAIDSLDPGTAVIYPLVFPDRLVTIVGVAGKPLQYYGTALSAGELEDAVGEFSASLTPFYQGTRQPGRQLYDWLVRPAEAWIAAAGVETLVLVPDGVLREVSLAALFDGEQYLIEKFSVAFSPGLALLPLQELTERSASILAAGLSESRQGFAPLPAVSGELQAIEAAVSDNRQLFNETFTNENFARALERRPANILHLATHGQFGSSADETFILTWDERIGIVELGKLLERRNRGVAESLELLVLSACSTATGDDRAALGIAGVAVRSGARSTLAGLWPLQDRAAAAFMEEFYRALAEPGTSRAQAVRRAQLSLMGDPRYAEPFTWAPFVLVGNWL